MRILDITVHHGSLLGYPFVREKTYHKREPIPSMVHQKLLIGYPFVREKTSPISRLLLYATLRAFL